MRIKNREFIIFTIFLIIILSINMIMTHFFSTHLIATFLILTIIFFKYYFIFEKNYVKYEGNVIFETIVFVSSFFIVYYLLGLIVGLTKTGNYFNFYNLTFRIVPAIIYIILREILRYNMMRKCGKSKLCMFLTVFLFVLMDLSFYIANIGLYSKQDVIRYLTVTLIPIISKNLAFSFVIRDCGYKPIIIFDLIFKLYPYIIPYVPNPNEFMSSMINMITPILFAFRIENFYVMKNEYIEHGVYFKRKINDYFVPVTLTIVLAYLFSGYFRYYAVVVASESMLPSLEVGDLVVLDQNSSTYKRGDIIAYKKNNKIIIHRINKIVDIDGDEYYYTKGDSNKSIDEFVVENEMIIGKVKFKLSHIGYPAVWLSRK